MLGVYASGSAVYAATSEGLTICTPPVSQVQGNGVTITSGDTTPSPADGTDFGGTTIGNRLVQAFTINNRDPYTFVVQGGVTAPGAALAFDGGDDYVTLPTSLNNQFANNRITVEGWFYPTASSGSGTPMLIGEAYTGDSQISCALYQEDTAVRCGFYNGSWQQTGAVNLTLNQWQHLACTYDQQSIQVYVNGEGMTGRAMTTALPAGNGAWYLGRRWDLAEYYSGAAALSLSGSPLVTVSGDSAFSVTTQPASNSITANSSTTFVVTFDPSTEGVVTATVTLANDDSDENPYTFVVQGEGLLPNAQLNSVACNLINAINAANSDAASDSCPAGSGADTITLLRDVAFSASNNIHGGADNALPVISRAITIERGSHTLSRTSGAPLLRLFYVASNGTLTLNQIILAGAAVGGLSYGGAIDNVGGTLTVNNSTLAGNDASHSFGGAIYKYNSGMLTVNNSTFSGNTSSYSGGAIDNSGTLTVNNSTFSSNRAATQGGAIYTRGTATLVRSLLSGNRATEADELYNDLGDPGFHIPGGTVNSSNNLFGHSNNAGTANFTLGATDIVPTQALAAILSTTLADNGGGTQTYALVAGSPALDAAGDSGLATDQRGVTRPQGAADDIGTFELAVVAAPEIDVRGNNISIANGDSTPAAADHTDFGSMAVNSGTVVRTFTISNTDATALTLSGSPLVNVTGNSAFTISSQPASSSVAAGGSTTFAVTFAPTISGTITATVSIANNDSDETPYTFVVQGAAAGQIDRGDQVTQASYTAVYQPTPQSCANAPAPGLPIHTLTPTLRNNTSNSYQGLYFVVTELAYSAAQGDNVPSLCNADGDNGGSVGARVTATDASLSDGFNPTESFAQAFQVGLPVRARYRLFVNLYALPTTVTAAEQGADNAANLIGVLSWEFDENGNLITSRQVFLPLIAN